MKKKLKSESLALRLEPKIKYGLELLARKQKRSITSVVEWIIYETLRRELVVEVKEPSTFFSGSVSWDEYYLDDVWDEDPVVRLLKLIHFDKSLLTYDDEKCWELICGNGYYWQGELTKNSFKWDTSNIDNLKLKRVRKDFNILQKIATGERPIEDLEQYWEPEGFINKSVFSYCYTIYDPEDFDTINELNNQSDE